MLRWESKISSEHIIELADEQGIPLMLGWMCCNQWEKWDQWSDEDHGVASQSLRSQILMLRPHASVFVWANTDAWGRSIRICDRMHPCSSGRTAATAGLRSRFVSSTAALCPSYIGRTPWSTPSLRLRRVRTEVACGTGFTWKGRTVGGLLRTGSAGDIPPRAGHARSRETTNTFPPWRVSRSSFPQTSYGRSTIPGSCTPERGAEIPH